MWHIFCSGLTQITVPALHLQHVASKWIEAEVEKDYSTCPLPFYMLTHVCGQEKTVFSEEIYSLFLRFTYQNSAELIGIVKHGDMQLKYS